MGQCKGGILLLAVNLTLPCVGHVQGGDRTSVDKDYCRCETLSGGWVHQVGIQGDTGPLSGLCSLHPHIQTLLPKTCFFRGDISSLPRGLWE